MDELASKQELIDDRQFLLDHLGENLQEVALALTRQRIKENPTVWKGKETTKVANGRIVRELRSKTRGLLLIYPLSPPPVVPAAKGDSGPGEPTGLAVTGTPIIGLALSFPTSDTATSVEYQVNKVWDVTVQEDAEYDD